MAIKRFRKILLTTLGLLPMFAPVDSARAAEATEGKPDYLASASELPWRKARLSLEAQTGTRTIGTLDAMIPFMGNDDFIIYADLMAKAQTNNAFEGNLGLGFRRVNDAETGIFGMYAFYDILKSVNNNQFTQVTVGAEHLGLVWDFRANAYLPVGKTKYVSTIYAGGKAQIVDHNIIEYIQSREETLSYGGDIEIGRIIGTNKLRGYVAMYTFGENLTGPRARLEYQITPRLTLNTGVQHDQTRGTQYFVGARFTIGGAKGPGDSIYTRLTDPVVRDIDVVTKTTTVDTTQIAQNKFWMVDQSKTSGGTGTITDPYASIEDAINNAPEGAIIYVKGVDGTVSQVNGTTLKQGQTLWGGTDSLYWDFVNDRARFAPDQNSLLLLNGNGIRPTISGTLIANSNVGFYNLNVIANDLARGATGITVENAKGVSINNILVSGFNAENGRAIAISGDSQVNLTKTNANNNYIGVDVAGGSVNVSDALVIDQSQLAGLRVQNAQVTADSMVITNSTQYGVFASGAQISVVGNLAVTGGASGVLAQLGANIKANSAHLTNTNLVVDASQIQITQDLNVSGDRIAISNGGSVQSDIANITTHTMNFNHGMWNSTHGAVTINGTNDIGLWLQNNSQVQWGATTISKAATSIQVDSASTLTLTDNLNTDNNVAINDAMMNVTHMTLANGNLTMLGANSKLTSTGVVDMAQDLTISEGSLTANDLILKGNVNITHARVNANNALSIDAASKHISLTAGAVLMANSANVNADSMFVQDSMWNTVKGSLNFAHDITVQNTEQNHAQLQASVITTQGNLSVLGANSNVTSSDTVTVAQDVAISQGSFNAKDMNLKGNVTITAKGRATATNALTIDAANKQISLTVGGQLIANSASVNTGSILIDNAVWNLTTAATTVNVTNDIVLQNSAKADFGAAAVTTKNISITGVGSELKSSGVLTVANNVAITDATLMGKTIAINGNVDVTRASLGASDSLTINANETAHLNLVSGEINVANATITTGNINLNSNFKVTNLLTIANSTQLAINPTALLTAGTANITTQNLQISGGQLTSTNTAAGQLTVNGNAANSFNLTNAQLTIANATIDHSNLTLNNSTFSVSNVLAMTNTPPSQASDPVTYNIDISNNSSVTAGKSDLDAGQLSIKDSAWKTSTDGEITLAGDVTIDTVNAAKGSVADFGAANLTSAGNITITGINNTQQQSQLLSRGILSAAKDITLTNAILDDETKAYATISGQNLTLTNATLNGKDITLTGNLTLATSNLNVANALTLTAPANGAAVALTANSTLEAAITNITADSLQIENSNWKTKASGAITIAGDVMVSTSATATQNSVADFGAANLTSAGNITITGINKPQQQSQLLSTGTISATKDITITNGLLDGKGKDPGKMFATITAQDLILANSVINAQALTVNGKIDLKSSQLMAAQSLIVNDIKKLGINIDTNSQLTAATATIATGNIDVNGNFIVTGDLKITESNYINIAPDVTMSAASAEITTGALNVNGGQLISVTGGKLTGQLTVTGAKANSFDLKAGAQVAIAKTTINNSNILVDGTDVTGNVPTMLTTGTLIAAQTPPGFYALTITNGAVILATDAATNMAINQVVLNNGQFTTPGTLTVDGILGSILSPSDGISLASNSILNVGNIIANNNFGNGIIVNKGVITATTITTNNNKFDGILVNNGMIVTSGLVASANNGVQTPGLADNIGHGLEVQGGTVNFHSYKGMSNYGDGINQSGGVLTITNASDAFGELTGNKYHVGATSGGNGFVKTGGTASLYNFNIKDNEQMGLDLNLNSTPTPAGGTPDFIGGKLDIEDNTEVGILLTQGNVALTDIIVKNNNVDDTTQKHFNQIIVRGNGDSNMRTLNILPGSSGNEISSGSTASKPSDSKSSSAVLIDSASTVNIESATISGNTDGYGVWVDAGTVTLTDLTSEHNQRAIVLTQGNLTINSSDISKNTEYGILADDLGGNATRELTLNNVYLTSNTKGTSVLEGAGYGLAVLHDTKITFNNSGLSPTPDHKYQVADNAAGGIYIASSSQPITLTGLTIYNNIGNGIDVNSTAAITLNITNSLIGNDPPTGTAQQNIGVNIKNADSLNMTLDNIQITGQKADGINVTTVNDITNMMITNTMEGKISNISNNGGAGIKATIGSGNATIKITNAHLNENGADGLNLIAQNPTSVQPQIYVKLTDSQISNNKHDGIYIMQKAIVTSTIDVENLQLTGNVNSGLHLLNGHLRGKITGTNQIPAHNLLAGSDVSGDWEAYE